MGKPFTGTAGAFITSWGTEMGGNFYSRLIAQTKDQSIVIPQIAQHHPVTGAGESVDEMIAGLSSWTARLTCFAFTTPRDGRAGMVTRAGLGTSFIRGWTLNLRSQVHDITSMAATPPTWQEFRPDVITADGTIEVQPEHDAALDQPDAADAAGASLVLRYGDEATTDDTITLNKALLRQLDINAAVRQVTGGVYQFANGPDGTIVTAGEASVFGDATATTTHTFGVPTWDEADAGNVDDIIITLASGRTLTGRAFWESIGMTCRVGEPVRIEVGIRGTGALTPA
jgi:hypothetical protein